VLRDDPDAYQVLPRRAWVRGLAVAGIATLSALVVGRADRLYRAEALRFEPRRAINRQASSGQGNLDEIVQAALVAFRRAVQVDPRNGQAWSDLSYATALSWHAHRRSGGLMGQLAEQAARRALELCPLNAEFWVRLGVALDMQGRPAEARRSYDRALQLAPHNSEYWYYLAYHLSLARGHEARALEAVAACLSLDPYNRQGLALREQLTARALRN
jgi:cytochrome c-type biogenesis protein CcmH/NrfG